MLSLSFDSFLMSSGILSDIRVTYDHLGVKRGTREKRRKPENYSCYQTRAFQ